MPPYALSPKDLGELLHLRGLRLTRAADRQRQLLRAAGKPGPCVPLPARQPDTMYQGPYTLHPCKEPVYNRVLIPFKESQHV